MRNIDALKKAPSLALPLFICIAALLHLSTIYLFNIVYQTPRVRNPSAAQVFFLPPGSTIYQQIAPWLKENDPAVFSPLKIIQHHRNSLSFSVDHVPSSPPLHLLPPAKIRPLEPPLLPVNEAVLPPPVLSSSRFLEKNDTVQRARHTRVSFLEALAPRALALEGMVPSLPTGSIPVAPTMVRVNVDAAGIPRHAIVVQPSGDSRADEAATTWIMQQRFAPSTHETWGTLLILWERES